jgi:hypothetical protein
MEKNGKVMKMVEIKEKITVKTALFEKIINNMDPFAKALSKLARALAGKQAYDLSVWRRKILNSPQCIAFKDERKKLMKAYVDSEMAKQKTRLEKEKKLNKKQVEQELERLKNDMMIYYDNVPGFNELMNVETDLVIEKLRIYGSGIATFTDPEKNVNGYDFDIMEPYIKFVWD